MLLILLFYLICFLFYRLNTKLSNSFVSENELEDRPESKEVRKKLKKSKNRSTKQLTKNFSFLLSIDDESLSLMTQRSTHFDKIELKPLEGKKKRKRREMLQNKEIEFEFIEEDDCKNDGWVDSKKKIKRPKGDSKKKDQVQKDYLYLVEQY